MQARALAAPAIGGVLGVGLAFVLTAPDGMAAWDELHAAHTRYLVDVGTTATRSVPIGALLGFGLALALPGRRALPAKRFLLPGAWLTLAPAAHLYGALLSLLSASRYAPKSEFLEAGIAQLALLGLAIASGVAFATRHRRARWVIAGYVVALVGSALSLLGPHGRAGFAHVLPLNDVLPRGTARVVALIAAYTLLGGAAVWALRAPREDEGQPDGATAGRALVTTASLLLAMLCLVAYALSSQFDRRPTTATTHLSLLFAALAYAMAAYAPMPPSRWLRIVAAPGLLLASAAYLRHLHVGAEDDPTRLMTIVVGSALVLALLLALGSVPWRRGRASDAEAPEAPS